MNTKIRLVSACLLLGIGTGASAATSPPQEAKPRIIITCDPELDDNNSLIRFLLYTTDFDVRGLIYAGSQFHWKGDGKGTTWWVPGREYARIGKTAPMTSYRYDPNERFIDDNVDAYAKVYANLKRHNPSYPTPDYLRSKIREGNVAFDGDFTKDTPGSELIKQEMLDSDTSVLFVQAWGGCSTIARALKSIEDIYGSQPYWKELKDRVSRKVILCLSGDQDDTYARYIKPFWPDIRQLETGGMQVDLTFFGPITASEEDKVYYSPEWTQQHIRSKGIFGERYRVWGDGKQMVKGDIFDFFGVSTLDKDELQRQGYILWMPLQPKGTFISEGDTFCYLNLIDNGLDAWKDQSWGGWTGAKTDLPSDIKEADKPAYIRKQMGFPDFTPAVQNGFTARMAWTVAPTMGAANHEPKIEGPSQIRVRRGQKVTVRCKVTDPDKDKLTLRWMQFHVGGYQGNLKIDNAATSAPIFTIPADAPSGQEIHAILEVTDNGTPPLTHYKRVILKVE